LRSATWVKAHRVTLRRFARRAFVAACVAAISALLIVFALLVYLQTASGRRLLAAKVSELVSGELVAELRIERIDVLASDRLVVSSATLFDEQKRAVLRVRGLSARFDLVTLISKAVFQPTVQVELPEIHAEQLEIGLYHAEPGGVSLTGAFSSRKPSTTPSKPGAGPHVHLRRISIDRVSASTDLSGLTQTTAQLNAVSLNIDVSPELFGLGASTEQARVSGALPEALQARVQAQVRAPGTTEVTLDGSVGQVSIQASFRHKGEELELRLSSASLAPEAMRAFVPAWPLHLPAAVKVEVAGPLSAMHALLEAQAGASRVTASGTVALSPSVKGELFITGRELDAQLFAPSLAPTALDVDAGLEFALDPAIHADLTTHWAKSDLFGVAVPELSIHAVYDAGQVTGSAKTADPALPVSLDFGLSAQGALKFHARVQSLDLVALAAYGVRAQGQIDFDATGELVQDKLVAAFEARMRGLMLSPLHAQTTVVRGRVQGSTTRPEQLGLDLQAEGAKLAVGTLEFPVWALECHGSLARQVVALRAGPETKPTLQASTTIAFDQGVGLSETQLDATLHGVKHQLALKFARFAGQALELRELRWQIGAGTLAGSASIGPARRQAELEVNGLEAESVLQTLGLDANAVRGRLNARLQFEEDGRARQGQLQGSFADGAVPALGPLHAEFDVKLLDSEVEGQVTLAVPELGQGKLSAHAALGKAPVTLDALAKVPGEIRLDVSNVELQEVSQRWLPAAKGLLSGLVDGSVRLAKSAANKPVTLSYELKTRELALHSRRANGEGSLSHAELSSQGEIGASNSVVQIELEDKAGPWISAKLEQSLGLAELLQVLRSSAFAQLSNEPLRAVISARPRSLELLGSVNPLAIRGEVAANIDITGTPRRPEFAGSLQATGLGTGTDASGKLALTLDYSAEREQYAFAARYENRGQGKLQLDGAGHFGWLEAGLGRDWSARAKARLEGVELAAIGDLLGVPMSGQVGGSAEVTASASQFETSVDLDLEQLALERHALGNGSARLRVRRGLADAHLSIAQADATLELSGELGVCWDGGPCVDPKRGGSLEARVRNYQLATLAPLLRSAASDVRGPLNGFMALGWEPADAKGKRKTRLRADATVSGGSVTLASGAGSFQCLKLGARGRDDDVLRLTLEGCSHSNQPNLWAQADVRLNGPVPERVEARLHFEKAPLSYEGVVLGSATVDRKGRPIQITVNLTGAQRTIEASIPALVFELPIKDDTSLVDLEEDPAIEVTEARAPPTSTSGSGENSQFTVSVLLGKAVSIRQQGMRVPVTGSLSVGADSLLDGSIIFPEGGVVPQLGQLFRLKRGSVRFDHQVVKEGVLNIEASTRTADGVVVDLYVSGTIAAPLIRFQSDPPRSENDIMALLLGVQGSDTATTKSGQQGGRGGAATALAMNQLLKGSALGGLQFGAGQTHKGDSVSTVSMRAGNSPVWLEARTVRSTTQRAANSGAQSSGVVDWRFARGFSLRTQLGNISGVELRWSHRY
jgi:hypothetical protein